MVFIMGFVFYYASINDSLFRKSKRRIPELRLQLDINVCYYYYSLYFINGHNKSIKLCYERFRLVNIYTSEDLKPQAKSVLGFKGVKLHA